MDYERICQLCGTPFSAGRIRCVDEPEEAAWGLLVNDFVTVAPDKNPCEADGCSTGERVQHTFRGEPVYEHLAEPDCTCLRGYSGSRIAWTEMEVIQLPHHESSQ
jgi:hypothetical protein